MSFVVLNGEEIDLNKGMRLQIITKRGRKNTFSLGQIADSEKIVKTIHKGEILWGPDKEKKTRCIRGKRFKNVQSATFVKVEGENYRGWWNIVNPNECERFWIDTGIDSSTDRVVFRIEKDGDDTIVYCFIP